MLVKNNNANGSGLGRTVKKYAGLYTNTSLKTETVGDLAVLYKVPEGKKATIILNPPTTSVNANDYGNFITGNINDISNFTEGMGNTMAFDIYTSTSYYLNLDLGLKVGSIFPLSLNNITIDDTVVFDGCMALQLDPNNPDFMLSLNTQNAEINTSSSPSGILGGSSLYHVSDFIRDVKLSQVDSTYVPESDHTRIQRIPREIVLGEGEKVSITIVSETYLAQLSRDDIYVAYDFTVIEEDL